MALESRDSSDAQFELNQKSVSAGNSILNILINWNKFNNEVTSILRSIRQSDRSFTFLFLFRWSYRCFAPNEERKFFFSRRIVWRPVSLTTQWYRTYINYYFIAINVSKRPLISPKGRRRYINNKRAEWRMTGASFSTFRIMKCAWCVVDESRTIKKLLRRVEPSRVKSSAECEVHERVGQRRRIGAVVHDAIL